MKTLIEETRRIGSLVLEEPRSAEPQTDHIGSMTRFIYSVYQWITGGFYRSR